MRAKVLEIDKIIFDGEISKVVIPAVNGEMCLLAKHIAIITPMKNGLLKIFKKNVDLPLIIDVNSGLCSFSENCAVFTLR